MLQVLSVDREHTEVAVLTIRELSELKHLVAILVVLCLLYDLHSPYTVIFVLVYLQLVWHSASKTRRLANIQEWNDSNLPFRVYSLYSDLHSPVDVDRVFLIHILDEVY